MRNGLGAVQSVALLGGNSDIGLAIVRRLASEQRLKRIALVGRNVTGLEMNAEKLRNESPGVAVDVVVADFLHDPTAAAAMDAVFADGNVDVVISAAGLLGTGADFIYDTDTLREMLRVNYESVILTGTTAIQHFQGQGYGTLVILSSVAAERPRADNFVYASTKAGIDAWANGLADALASSPVDVVVVRPGFVHSKMTAGLPSLPLATTPDEVAEITVTAIAKRTPLVWAPRTVRPLMSAMRHLPRPVFRAVSKRAQR